jgi:HEAT repeat protein
LFAYPKPALVKEILREASDEHSYHRATAIFALGAYPSKDVEKLLLSLLAHPSSNIRSTAAKSLARIGNTTALERVQHQAADPGLDLWARMNYLIAISLMDKEQTYLKHLFEMADHTHKVSFNQTMFSLAARMLDFKPVLSELYQEENLERTSGLRMLLEEARQLQPFFEDFHRLLAWYTEEKYQEIWQWCRIVLAQDRFTGRFPELQQAITMYDVRCANRENTFAALYFLYQIMS